MMLKSRQHINDVKITSVTELCYNHVRHVNDVTITRVTECYNTEPTWPTHHVTRHHRLDMESLRVLKN